MRAVKMFAKSPTISIITVYDTVVKITGEEFALVTGVNLIFFAQNVIMQITFL